MKKGFIAITSALILSAVLMVVMLLASTATWYSRADSLEFEYKKVSQSLAEGCLQVALLKIAQNYTYIPMQGGELVAVGSDSCTIFSVTYSAEDLMHSKEGTVDVRALYQNVRTHLAALVAIKNPSFATPSPVIFIKSITEIP